MRYVAKIHVLDVLDKVIVSGYCYDADSQTTDSPVQFDFAYESAGTGIDDPLTWLIWHTYDAFHQTYRTPAVEG